MSQHDYVIENQSGLNFRSDLNDALEAIVTNNSGNSEPTDTFPFMMWVDSSTTPKVLKIRNSADNAWYTIGSVDGDNFGLQAPYAAASAPASPIAYQLWVDTSGTVGGIYGTDKVLKIRNTANSAWVIIGSVTVANFGMLPLAGGTITGATIFNSTGYITVPVGNTAARPGSPTDGMIRYNSTLVQFEGYGNSAWAPIGGGGYTVTSVQSITAAGNITISTTVTRQLRHVQGNAASVTTATTPFSTSPPPDGTEITLIGNDDANSVIIPFNDATHGCVGNFTSIELTKYKVATFIYCSGLGRYVLQQGGI